MNKQRIVNLIGIKKDIFTKRLNLLDSPGFYVIPVNEDISETGAIVADVKWVTNGGIQIIVISDNYGNYLDLLFNGKEFVRLTDDGKVPNWMPYGHQVAGILSSYVINGKTFRFEIFKNDCEEQGELNVGDMINEIAEKEPDVAKAIGLVVKHIHGTYSDKYAKGQDIIDTKKMLYDKERGDFLNIYQVNRYLQRYLTKGSKKSHLIKDIEKAIHYLIFELTRRIKMDDANEIEPTV